jgi:hypothetical protein
MLTELGHIKVELDGLLGLVEVGDMAEEVYCVTGCAADGGGALEELSSRLTVLLLDLELDKGPVWALDEDDDGRGLSRGSLGHFERDGDAGNRSVPSVKLFFGRQFFSAGVCYSQNPHKGPSKGKMALLAIVDFLKLNAQPPPSHHHRPSS